MDKQTEYRIYRNAQRLMHEWRMKEWFQHPFLNFARIIAIILIWNFWRADIYWNFVDNPGIGSGLKLILFLSVVGYSVKRKITNLWKELNRPLEDPYI